MGRTYLFECPQCGYSARVSGGADRGFHFAVQTIHCVECQVLYDAVTRFRLNVASRVSRLKGGSVIPADKTPAHAPAFLAALNRLPPASAKPIRWLNFALACPVSPRHRVREWTQPGKCPRCNLFLERSAVPFRIWE